MDFDSFNKQELTSLPVFLAEVLDIMRVLHHHELYASSRIIRLLIAERGIVCLPKSERPWNRVEEFLRLNPAGDVPVLMTEDGEAICGASVIAEYLEEIDDKTHLMRLDRHVNHQPRSPS